MKGYRTIYSVHRGTELIAEGTQREIMEKTGINASSLWAKDMRGELKWTWCERRYAKREPKAKSFEWHERHRESNRRYYQAHKEEILKRNEEKRKNGKR